MSRAKTRSKQGEFFIEKEKKAQYHEIVNNQRRKNDPKGYIKINTKRDGL